MKLNIHLKCTNQRVELILEKSGDYLPQYTEINFCFPKNEKRECIINGKLTSRNYKMNLLNWN
ncbi:hypothetical protein BKG95_10040 [Rodentibacter pneumotropicus]|nr:hypothetical protein BKG95_10040 [Rodentibacter pneumotropicus]